MFGILLKQIMKKYKITGKKLSILSNLTEGFISDIKNEKTLPKQENLKKIINSFEMSSSEKIALQIAWEKDSAPQSFVKRFDELQNDYDILSSFYIVNDIKDSLKIKKIILDIQKENIFLKKEINYLNLYKDFFDLLHEDDKKYLINKVIFDNKKNNFTKLLRLQKTIFNRK